MHSTTGHRGTGRTAVLAATVLAVMSLSACGPLGGSSDESSSTGYEPVQTTSTTEPSTSTSSSTGGDPPPPLPQGDTLLARAKGHMGATSTVTIDGTFYLEDKNRTEVKLHSEGSTGGVLTQEEHAGASRTTLTLANGGTLEVRALGWYHYLKADEKWFATVGSADNRMARHGDQWLKIRRDESPVNDLRPNRVIKGSFFGHELTVFDAARATVSADRLDGEWAYRLDLSKAGKGRQVPRTMWVSTEADAPEMLQLTFGQYPQRYTYTFSKWNNTSEEFETPTGAKALEGDQVGDVI